MRDIYLLASQHPDPANTEEYWQSLINDCKDPKAIGHTASMKIYFEMLGLYAQKINIGGIDKVIIAGADKLED